MDRLTQNFGFGIVPKQVMKDNKLSIQSKAIYAYLCTYAGNKDTAFPSISLITHELKISKDTFYKYLHELKNGRYIETQQVHEKGKFSHSLYCLLPFPKSSDTVISDTETSYTEDMETNINSININSIKKNKKDYGNIVDSFTDNKELRTSIIDFIDMRKKQKNGITNRAIELMLMKLSKMSKNDNERIEILNQSIMSGYQGIFPLKTDIKNIITKRQGDFGSPY